MKLSFRASRASVLASLLGGFALFCVPAPTRAADEAPKFVDPYAARKTGPAYQTLPVVASAKNDFLAGRIVDETGKPISGAKVDAFHWFPGSETVTNAKGEFRLTSTSTEYKAFEAGDKLEVTFSAPGFTPRYIAAQPLGTLKAPLILRRDTFIEGTVRGSDGKPVANAEVRAVNGPFYGDGVVITDVPYLVKSDAKGHYKLFLQSGNYELFVRGAQGVSRVPKVALASKTRVEKNVTLQPGATFRAQVVDSLTGKPVAGLKLMSDDYKAVSDKNGVIAVPNMYEGPFHWDVQSKNIARWWSEAATNDYQRKSIEKSGWQRNFDSLDFKIAKGMAPVKIVAERGVRIRGRVLSPSGQPVAGATVDPAMTGTGNSLTGDTRFSVRTNAKGEYDGVFPAGNGVEWNLTAHDGKYDEWRKWANATAPPIQTKPGQQIENYDLKLQQPLTLTGKVVDKTGRAVANAEVRAVQADKHGNRYYDPTTRTDANGNFTLRYVAPGRQYVQVEPFWLLATEAPAASTKLVEVKAGQPLAIGTLTQVETR